MFFTCTKTITLFQYFPLSIYSTLIHSTNFDVCNMITDFIPRSDTDIMCFTWRFCVSGSTHLNMCDYVDKYTCMFSTQ